MKRFLINSVAFATLAIAVNTVAACPAYAYLDAGTSAAIYQAVIAIVVGGAVAIKVYWVRIKRFFGGKKAATDSDAVTDTKAPNGDV
jgi:hypothetical protein